MQLDCLDIAADKDCDLLSQSEIEEQFPAHFSCSASHRLKSTDEHNRILHIDIDRQLCSAAVASSDRSVSLLDTCTLASTLVLAGHTGRVTGVKWSPTDANVLVTSCLDGVVRHFDSRSGHMELQQLDKSSGSCKPLTCCAINAAGQCVCAGTELCDDSAFLVFWDTRRPQPLGGYWQSHADDVTQVSFHPSDAGALCSASVDGLLNVYDVRQSCETDALSVTVNCDQCLDSLVWLERADGRLVAGSSSMQSVQVCDVTAQDLVLNADRHLLCASIQRKMCELCYVVGCHAMDDDSLMVVVHQSGACTRLLRLSSEQKTSLRPLSNLHPSCTSGSTRHTDIHTSALHAQSNTLITGGDDGMLVMWTAEK